VILVYLTVQKITRVGDDEGTSFEQCEQRVAVIRVANRAMGARIAPGDMWLHPRAL
jgi:hypothetical protein